MYILNKLQRKVRNFLSSKLPRNIKKTELNYGFAGTGKVFDTIEAGVYPCDNPFAMAYVFPRTHTDVKLCTYHPSLAEMVGDITSMEQLEEIHKNHPELIRRRKLFLERKFIEAGCDEGCGILNAYKITKKGIKLSEESQIKIKTIWLSVGPDCNLRCRYCMEPDKFFVDFNTCNPNILKIAMDFVKQGGHLILTGGETFLPKWGLLGHLKELNQTADVQGRIDIHTNGTYLNTPEIREIVLNAPFSSIGVSMDTYQPALFNYIRKGSVMNDVLINVLALLKEKNKKYGKNTGPSITILCAVMKSTAMHLEQTVKFYTELGLNISLNAIFQCGFSPEFCEKEGLHNLSIDELRLHIQDIKRIGETCENVNWQGYLGQVDTILQNKLLGVNSQVVLGRKG